MTYDVDRKYFSKICWVNLQQLIGYSSPDGCFCIALIQLSAIIARQKCKPMGKFDKKIFIIIKVTSFCSFLCDAYT